MAYLSDLDAYIHRVLPRLEAGPLTLEQLGVSRGVIKVLQRNGVVRPKMEPWYNREGRRIGAIEEFCLAPPPAPRPAQRRARLWSCAHIDFAALGIA